MTSSQTTAGHNAAQLSQTLEEIAAIDAEISALEDKLKERKKRREHLERLAVEDMTAQRLGGVSRVAGRSWRVEENLCLSVSKDRRDAVLEAARAVGIEDEITTVATATLKSWLKERAREAGREAGRPFTEGTPFEGLVGEFIKTELRYTTLPS